MMSFTECRVDSTCFDMQTGNAKLHPSKKSLVWLKQFVLTCNTGLGKEIICIRLIQSEGT